jgi:hypothetical protein
MDHGNALLQQPPHAGRDARLDQDGRALSAQPIVHGEIGRSAGPRDGGGEIDGDVTALEAGAQRAGVENVRGTHLDTKRRECRGLLGSTHEAADLVATCREPRHQVPAVDSVRAEDGDGRHAASPA